MIIVIIVASFFQYLFRIRSDLSNFDIIYFFKEIYQKPIRMTYWFLYVYLVFLIILPFLRNLVKNMKKEHYYYLFAIYTIYKIVIPIITKAININISNYLEIQLLEIGILCPILGHFCENILDINKINKKHIIFGTISTILIVITALILTTLEIKQTGNTKTETYLTYGVEFVSAYLYIFIKYIFAKIKLPKIISKIIITFGSYSFGVYLMEGILRTIFFDKLMKVLIPIMKTMNACIIAVLFIIFIGTIITMILKRIPYVKKFI